MVFYRPSCLIWLIRCLRFPSHFHKTTFRDINTAKFDVGRDNRVLKSNKVKLNETYELNAMAKKCVISLVLRNKTKQPSSLSSDSIDKTSGNMSSASDLLFSAAILLTVLFAFV